MWDTLEDYTAILTYTWDDTKDDSTCSVCMCVDESAKNDRQAPKLWDFKAGTTTVITWAFMAMHVEEMTDKRTTWRPRKSTSVEEMPSHFPTLETEVLRQDVRRTL
jgi:hypothetical protein